MTDMPLWALTLTYWMHLLATITWIGGLAMLAIIVWPLMADSTPVLERIERRFRPFVNGSLAVLFITGMAQMTANPNYGGLLVIDSIWAGAMFIKHVVFGVMLLISLVIQVGVLPRIERANLLKQNTDTAFRRLRALVTTNLILGSVVLLLTAVMTASA